MTTLIFAFACVHALLMLVWFKSDAFPEWLNLFGLGKLIKYQVYQDAKLVDASLTYPIFLKMRYGRFFLKLVGCPLCFCVWLSFTTAILISRVQPYIESAIVSFVIYGSVLCLLTLFIYGHISRLLNENK